MNLTKRSVGRYLLKHLASAGFTMLIFLFFCLLLAGDEDGYRALVAMKELKIWPIIYVYGISSALVIDLILRTVSRYREAVKVILYILFGFAYYSYSLKYNSFGMYIFLGVFGIIFALMYYWGTFLFHKLRWSSYIFALVIPIILFTVMTVSLMDRHVNWKETTYTQNTHNTYEATFDYFNGTKQIAVDAHKGQILTFKIVWDTQGVGHGGATGQYVLQPNGEYAGMEQSSDHQTLVRITEDGTYKIVADADRLKGSLKVVWEIH